MKCLAFRSVIIRFSTFTSYYMLDTFSINTFPHLRTFTHANVYINALVQPHPPHTPTHTPPDVRVDFADYGNDSL